MKKTKRLGMNCYDVRRLDRREMHVGRKTKKRITRQTWRRKRNGSSCTCRWPTIDGPLVPVIKLCLVDLIEIRYTTLGKIRRVSTNIFASPPLHCPIVPCWLFILGFWSSSLLRKYGMATPYAHEACIERMVSDPANAGTGGITFGLCPESNSQCFKVLQSVILQLLPLFVKRCEVTVGLWKTMSLSWVECESRVWFNDEFCFFKCESGIFCGQVVIFVDADNAARKQRGLHPNRFADLYHSANRTPVSTSEDWYHVCSVYSWITIHGLPYPPNQIELIHQLSMYSMYSVIRIFFEWNNIRT